METRETNKNKNIIVKTTDYLKKNGIKKTLKKIHNKFFRLEVVEYEKWRRGALPDERELAKQRRESFAYSPLISIVVPLYRTPVSYFQEMVSSVMDQTYGNFELCLADGSGAGEQSELRTEALRIAGLDRRIKYLELEENQGISGNTNAALRMAAGDFVALLDHDDLLSPDALYEIVSAVNRNMDADVLYTDEDKVDMKGKRYFEPHFKPDFNPDLLCTMNYICHLFVVKKELLNRAGGFRAEYDGAQDYDFIFRCTEEAGRIVHIPKVLYHWRSHQNSTAENPESKRYAFEAGLRAVESHYKRTGQHAQVKHGLKYGMYETVYPLSERPLVSVIIPNKDHVEDLDICLKSLRKQSYPNFEVIIVENNSTEEQTFSYYEQQEKADSRIKVIRWEGVFNYSAINNFGVDHAAGEYLLLLNNDTEFITENGLEKMLGFCMRQGTGAVGAKLFYGDDTIQHAGVIIGMGGVAGHAFPGLPKDDYGYMARAHCTQDLSAVTAACMMVPKHVFEQVGGFEEQLAVAFNDVDLCMKIRGLGLLVVYEADVCLYHYESKSRGLEDTPEKVARFNREVHFFQERWAKELEAGDPYYNPNLTLARNDFTCRNPYETVGE